MTWTISERFPLWGDSGQSPSDGFFYQGEEQIAFEHQNYLWRSLYELNQDTLDAAVDIDNDEDGVVDGADTANLYKDTDIDTDGDGVVDGAVSTGLVEGVDIDTEFAFADMSDDAEPSSIEYVYETELADGDTLSVSKATLISGDGTAAPDGLSLRFIILDGSGTSDGGSILDGDGSTLYVDESSTASYTNSSGGPQAVAVGVDGGVYSTGISSEVDVFTSVTMTR